jgi:hypothetical protein
MCSAVFYLTKTSFLLCFFCCAMAACNPNDTHQQAMPAFYHWQTKLQLAPAERNYLDSLGVKKLYAKFFDVDWDEATAQPMPLATIELDTTLLSGIEIVPCIFITNRTLLSLPMQQVDTLAFLIAKKITALAVWPPKEIQFDCDWTERTREKYFALLESFRRIVEADSSLIPNSSFLISATIRLHQFKYLGKTGIPPVDRGMLMCYNMGDLEDWGIENSIIDHSTANAYLHPASSIQYPLELDLALPIFRWGVLFRDGKMIRLLNGLSKLDLNDASRFHRTAPNRYEVVSSTYLNAHYLYKDDQIRLEASSAETVVEVAALLNNKVALGQVFTVAFYHLDTATVNCFPKEKIKDVLQQF